MLTVKSLLLESGYEAWFEYENFVRWLSLAEVIADSCKRPIQRADFITFAATKLEYFGPTNIPRLSAHDFMAEVMRIRAQPKAPYGVLSPVWGQLL